MEKGGSSNGTSKTSAVAGAGDAKEHDKMTTTFTEDMVAAAFQVTEDMTPERRVAVVFAKATFEDALRYTDMTEDEVVEEYRRAGKLHTYDPDKEWQKRAARVARIYPPPEHMKAEVEEYMKYLDEEEEEYILLHLFSSEP